MSSTLILPQKQVWFRAYLSQAFIWKHPRGHRMTKLLIALIDYDGWVARYVFSEAVLAIDQTHPRQHVYAPFKDYVTKDPKGFEVISLGELTHGTTFTPSKPRRVDEFEVRGSWAAHGATLLSPRVSKGYFLMQLDIHLADADERLELRMNSSTKVELPASREVGGLRLAGLIRQGALRDSVHFWQPMRPP